MQSTMFIKQANELATKIRTGISPMASVEEEQAWGNGIQKELNNLFSGLANPTLPSAFQLRDVALDNGFTISPATREKLAAFENWSC